MGNGGDVVRSIRLIRQQGGIAVLFFGVITVHGTNWPLAHVTRDNQHAFAHQKNHFAEIAIRKQAVQSLQFRVRQDGAFWNIAKCLGHQLARLIVEKPEASHR